MESEVKNMNETLEGKVIPKGGPSTREVPRSFSDLTPEKYDRLTYLLDEHIKQMQKGCLRAGIDLLTGKVAIMIWRLGEMTELAGLPDRAATNQLIAGASLICVGSTTLDEVMG